MGGEGGARILIHHKHNIKEREGVKKGHGYDDRGKIYTIVL